MVDPVRGRAQGAARAVAAGREQVEPLRRRCAQLDARPNQLRALQLGHAGRVRGERRGHARASAPHSPLASSHPAAAAAAAAAGGGQAEGRGEGGEEARGGQEAGGGAAAAGGEERREGRREQRRVKSREREATRSSTGTRPRAQIRRAGTRSSQADTNSFDEWCPAGASAGAEDPRRVPEQVARAGALDGQGGCRVRGWRDTAQDDLHADAVADAQRVAEEDQRRVLGHEQGLLRGVLRPPAQVVQQLPQRALLQRPQLVRAQRPAHAQEQQRGVVLRRRHPRLALRRARARHQPPLLLDIQHRVCARRRACARLDRHRRTHRQDGRANHHFKHNRVVVHDHACLQVAERHEHEAAAPLAHRLAHHRRHHRQPATATPLPLHEEQRGRLQRRSPIHERTSHCHRHRHRHRCRRTGRQRAPLAPSPRRQT